MPNMGNPSSKISGEHSGASMSYTDEGPPESTMARGLSSRICSTLMSNGWISQ
jgi:hypothetical protein